MNDDDDSSRGVAGVLGLWPWPDCFVEALNVELLGAIAVVGVAWLLPTALVLFALAHWKPAELSAKEQWLQDWHDYRIHSEIRRHYCNHNRSYTIDPDGLN